MVVNVLIRFEAISYQDVFSDTMYDNARHRDIKANVVLSHIDIISTYAW
jgi:hypothetical protein